MWASVWKLLCSWRKRAGPRGQRYSILQKTWILNLTTIYNVLTIYICTRSLCDDVGVRFGEARFGSWTSRNHAGVPRCCPSLCQTTRAIWQTDWWISIYTGGDITKLKQNTPSIPQSITELKILHKMQGKIADMYTSLQSSRWEFRSSHINMIPKSFHQKTGKNSD